MTSIPDEKTIESIRKTIFDNLTWSKEQTTFLNRAKLRNEFLASHEVKFTDALLINIRRSFFGTYLDTFNRQQKQNRSFNENKFGITKWDLKDSTPDEVRQLIEKNAATEDMFSLLAEAVEKREIIDWDFLHEKLETLRVSDFNISVVDREAGKFENLQILVLSGNWITDVPGAHLPRKLKFLELFANQICNLESLANGPPRKILHVGLGRNRLTDGSGLHLLAKSGKFRHLMTLDLSDNDIHDLKLVLEAFRSLNQLVGLLLEGNPCSVCEQYKALVLKYLPELLYLDATEILAEDRIPLEDIDEDQYKAAVVFTCHRIIGLQPPPKEKGVIQTIHVEVSFPLLEEIIIEPEIEETVEIVEEDEKGKGKKNKKVKEDKSKSKKSSSKKSSKKGKKGKTASPYDAPDEYSNEIKNKTTNTSFKTERVPWAKIIQFPEDALIVESPENDLKAIRDSFRSCVSVKVIYLKILPPQKKKKEKKSKKEKNKKGDRKNDKIELDNKIEEEPKETILKKVTLADFFCDLHNVNWSDKTIDFYWADHPKTKPNAIAVTGSLRAINYVEGKNKGKGKSEKGDKKSKKDAKEKIIDDANVIMKVPSKEFLPNLFTCQVGFGLKRL